MSAGKRANIAPPQVVDGCHAVNHADEDFTPQVVEQMRHAAAAVRETIKAVEAARDAAVDRSHAESTCREALGHLEETLYYLEWRPPTEAEQAEMEAEAAASRPHGVH